MLKIREAQLSAIQRVRREQFQEWLARHLRERLPNKTSALDDPALADFVRRGHARAEAFGLTRGSSICMFVDLLMALGEDFDKEGTIKERLASTAIVDPNDRVDAVAAMVAQRAGGNG
jgi:hypothetical protein